MKVFSDLLISINGVPGTIRKNNEKQFVEMHIGSEDLLYKDTFILPRLAAGAFIKSLSVLFKDQYNMDFNYEQYGKPKNHIFDYVSKTINNY